jgi:DnaJ-class molecular chaperone
MDERDYYQRLEISRSASDKDIRAAFRRLARECHPDVKPGDDAAAERFKSLSEAYTTLSDPAKRDKYDALGSRWERYEQPAGFDFYTWWAGGGR